MDAAPGSQPPRQVRVDSVSCRSECLRDILFRGLGSQWEIGGTTTDGLVKVILSWGHKRNGLLRGRRAGRRDDASCHDEEAQEAGESV